MPPNEFHLLRFLMTHPQVAPRHGTIMNAVWDWKYPDERNALRICVNRLRKRLGDTATEPASSSPCAASAIRSCSQYRNSPPT